MNRSDQRLKTMLKQSSQRLLANFYRVLYPSCCVSCYQEIDRQSNRQEQPTISSPAPIAQQRASSELTRPFFHESSSVTPFFDWQSQHWCHACWKLIDQQPSHRCLKCGAGLNKPSPFPHSCPYCREHRLRFEKGTAVGNYEHLLKELVVKMKNQKNDSLAVQLGNLLGYHLVSQAWIDFDLVIPVPTFWSRRLLRGFQATEILVERVGRITGIPAHHGIIRMIRKTAKQGTLSATGRKSNVRDAFCVKSRTSIAAKRLLIIDDVMTTGATTSEIARILKARGAAEVSVAVVARATGIG